MKALAVGGAMIDTIAIIASDRIEQMTMKNADNSFLLLEEGRKTEAVEISTHVGGGAVNATVNLAINENPMQTAETQEQMRKFTVETVDREVARSLADAIAAGRA